MQGQPIELAASTEEHRETRIDEAIGYVPKVARRYRGCGIPFDDLLGAGNLGLVEAALRFDPSRGVKFVTYADWWIRKAILQTLERELGAVRLPRYRQQQLKRLADARRRFREERGRDAEASELQASSGLRERDVHKLDRLGRNALSLDEPARPGAERSLGDALLQDEDPDPQDRLIRRDSARFLREILQALTPKEKRVMRLRFGFDGRDPMTLRAIGRELGISRERVRQLEGRALERLRTHVEELSAER